MAHEKDKNFLFAGKTIEDHKQALEIAREIGDRQGEETRLGNLRCAYHALSQFKKARAYYNQSILIFEEIKSPYAEQVRDLLADLEADDK